MYDMIKNKNVYFSKSLMSQMNFNIDDAFRDVIDVSLHNPIGRKITSIFALEILFRLDKWDLPCFANGNLFIHCPLTFNIAAIVNF